jgi:hypothetical protein
MSSYFSVIVTIKSVAFGIQGLGLFFQSELIDVSLDVRHGLRWVRHWPELPERELVEPIDWENFRKSS